MTKRTETKYFARRFQNIELRIGNNREKTTTEAAAVQLSRNPLVGYYNGNNLDEKAIFRLETGAHGRFLTLQLIGTNYLDVWDMDVFNQVQ